MLGEFVANNNFYGLLSQQQPQHIYEPPFASLADGRMATPWARSAKLWFCQMSDIIFWYGHVLCGNSMVSSSSSSSTTSASLVILYGKLPSGLRGWGQSAQIWSINKRKHTTYKYMGQGHYLVGIFVIVLMQAKVSNVRHSRILNI